MMANGKEENKADEDVVHRSRHDVHGDEELSTSVLLALDTLPEFDIESGSAVVFDHIDLDALDDIFSPVNGQPRSGHVTFAAGDYEVTATSDGEITIRDETDA